MRMPAQHKTQQQQLTPELKAMQEEAKSLFVFGQTQTKEYTEAAERFNSAVIAAFGKENCGFLLLVTK